MIYDEMYLCSQQHMVKATIAPLTVRVGPSTAMSLGAWFKSAAAVVIEEDRFAIGDASALATGIFHHMKCTCNLQSAICNLQYGIE